ncbi:MAG: HAD hydrolase family protein [Flavobacteriales bacterium]|jgi:3-deoxy-D-manno-octulosonate 8-phosphate phosphatase (KDO 8-P phosphatase)|tara:strand:+ start:17350 stop:17844 length:495 start_codon:yes stop_codon:yes gene_type:complete
MNYKQLLTQISTFIFDVDGVLTDGSILLMPSGEQVRNMNTKDGLAIRKAISLGYRVAIISGGKSEGLKKRLEYLGIVDAYLGCLDKKDALNDLIAIYDLDVDNVLYMGDDLNDLEIMKEVALPTCPQDGASEVKAISKYVSHKDGGKGCVRDVIEQTLRVQKKW